jgi:CDP-diacylglycerol--glycerol-3-phosphate 3-phosphatidyltransferase
MLNVANILTVSRLLLVPLFVGALFTDDGTNTFWRSIATGLFMLASFTDQLDGWVARRYGLVTDFGKIADPIADKALTGAALIGLSLLGQLAWWITIVIAVREIGVTVLRFWVLRFGVIAASRGGKAKTLAQMVAIVAYLLPIAGTAADIVRWVVMGIAVALTVITGLDYLVRALRVRRLGLLPSGPGDENISESGSELK